MCEGVDFCPGTGRPIEAAPCNVAKNFMDAAKEVIDSVSAKAIEAMNEDQKFIETLTKR